MCFGEVVDVIEQFGLCDGIGVCGCIGGGWWLQVVGVEVDVVYDGGYVVVVLGGWFFFGLMQYGVFVGQYQFF